ncbi:hypothetical protein BSP239C_03827 [Brevibacterium sp. 239c]|uniref:hypothetical protein n=1 Tax=Brevibacterium sp. 239c TaxID=1965356 RepID=UPI000C5C5C9F|nr:hypothetical protein [Brevibacterium sp. 239c]SMY04403.1 hypothetical protein BSP239C_03827 [Brevibacterium sp. 239c]
MVDAFEPGSMPWGDLHKERLAAADAVVSRMRREVVISLANAHEDLMNRPARDRFLIDDELRYRLTEAVSEAGVSRAIRIYEESSTVLQVAGDTDGHRETAARAAHLKAFQTAITTAEGDLRPWLAGMSVTTAEVVSPERMPYLRQTREWGAMQQASLEATVSCMPPNPESWTAADGRGLQRLEAQNADVAAWSALDRPPSENLTLDEPVAAGHLLREQIAQRLKPSCRRTDLNEETKYEVYSSHEYWRDTQTRLVSVGVPEGADLEQEEFVEVPNEDGPAPTSDWWALRNGVPVEIDSFPAPNESVQQHADVRFKLPRPVWEASRESMGPAFDHVVIEGERDVDVTVSAQQRLELRERAEDVQFRTVYNAQERIESIQSSDDFSLDGGETAQEVAVLRDDSERVAYQCSVVVGALNSAKPVTMHNSAPAPSVATYLSHPPTPAPAVAGTDLDR